MTESPMCYDQIFLANTITRQSSMSHRCVGITSSPCLAAYMGSYGDICCMKLFLPPAGAVTAVMSHVLGAFPMAHVCAHGSSLLS